MSAKNYKTCHNCERLEAESLSQARKAHSATYGKIGEADYRRQQERLDAGKFWPEDQDEYIRLRSEIESLREDYEFWFDENKFRMRYHASCQVCGFDFKFNERL